MNHKVLAKSPLSLFFSMLLLAGALAACSDPVAPEDITPPDAPTGLDAVNVDRITSAISWVAPADDDGAAVAAYELRFAREELGASNFATWGTVIATAAPSMPGLTDSADHIELPGYGFFLGIVAIDEAGNRSAPSAAGPFFQEVDASSLILPPEPDNNNGLGYQIASADFNNDGFRDLAVSAPFKQVVDAVGAGTVYVYFGSADGIGADPDIEIAGTEAMAQLGNSLAALDWNGDGRDDLAIGAPFATRVYLFDGENLVAGTTLADSDADTIIEADPGSAWFAGSYLGWSLVAGQFDGDDRDDLAIASVFADSGVGAVVLLYGGTSAGGDIQLSEVDAALMDGAVADVMFAPGVAPGSFTAFGAAMSNLGRSGPGNPDQLGIAFIQGADAFVIRGRANRPADPGAHVLDFDPAVDLRATVDPLDPETFFGYAQGAIMDIDGDGYREIAIGSYRDGPDAGTVTIVNGAAVGEVPLADVTISTITGLDGQLFGSAITSSSRGYGSPDFNADGNPDLVIAGGLRSGEPGVALHIWYDDGFHDFTQNLTADSADIEFFGPMPEFVGTPPTNGGTPITARSVGDINGDGFDDIVWADWEGNELDGSLVMFY